MNTINNIKHFILNTLAGLLVVFTFFELLGGIHILGELYRTYGDKVYIIYLVPVLIIGIISFKLACILACHRTKEDKKILEERLNKYLWYIKQAMIFIKRLK